MRLALKKLANERPASAIDAWAIENETSWFRSARRAGVWRGNCAGSRPRQIIDLFERGICEKASCDAIGKNLVDQIVHGF